MNSAAQRFANSMSMNLRHAAALDLSARLDDPVLREVLALAVGDPTPEKINQVCGTYRDARDWKILGYSTEDGDIVACAGVEITGLGEATIQHMAVVPRMRRRGIARKLLDDIRQALCLLRMKAETDGEAVGFYEKCRFAVESLGEVHPGVERFLCCYKSDDLRLKEK